MLQDSTEYCTLHELKQSNLRTLELVRQVSSEATQIRYHLEGFIPIEDNSKKKQQESMNMKSDILLLEREGLANRVKSLSKLRDEMILQAMSKSAELNILQAKRSNLQDLKRDFEISKELKKCASDCMKHELGQVSKILAYTRESKAVKILRSYKIVTNLTHPSSKRNASSDPATAATAANSMNPLKKQSMHLHGCSTIMGLPIPNNGFYDHVPLEVLCSIINLVSKVVKMTADSLHIALPHPLEANKGVLSTAAELVLYPHDDRQSPILLVPAELNMSTSIIENKSKSNIDYIWHSISDIRLGLLFHIKSHFLIFCIFIRHN